MTHTLLMWLGSIRTRSLSAWLLISSVVLCILPFTLLLDIRKRRAHARSLRAASEITTLTCQAGHNIEVYGHWTCRCGMNFTGSGLLPCPHCQEQEHALQCHCGRQVVSPISPLYGDDI